MKQIEQSFQEFIDAIQTARDEDEFERVPTRVTRRLGLRWFPDLNLLLPFTLQ